MHAAFARRGARACRRLGSHHGHRHQAQRRRAAPPGWVSSSVLASASSLCRSLCFFERARASSPALRAPSSLATTAPRGVCSSTPAVSTVYRHRPCTGCSNPIGARSRSTIPPQSCSSARSRPSSCSNGPAPCSTRLRSRCYLDLTAKASIALRWRCGTSQLDANVDVPRPGRRGAAECFSTPAGGIYSSASS